MLQIKLSEATAARRRVPVVLVDATDGVTAETGVTLSAGDMKISKAGGAEANHAGTLTELAGGDYYYEFTAGELDTVGYITGRIVKAGCRTFRIAAQVVAFDPYDAAGLGLSRVDAAVSTRASQTSVDTVDDFLDTEIAAIKSDTAAILIDTAEIGAAGAGLTALPWNAAWDAEVQSECTDALNAYDPPTKAELDAAVANVSVDEIQASALADLFNTDSGTTYASAVAGSVVKEIADNAGGASLTVQDIVDGVWDEPTASHATAGTTGKALTDAGSAGDPWSTALPGAYGAGTAGKIVGDNINATISSRATQTSVDTIDDFLDTEIAAILAAVDTEVAAILADTNELQTDWADGGRLDLILDARASQTSVNTIDDFLDTEVAAIKAKTDQLTFTTANQVDSTAVTVSDKTGYSVGVGGIASNSFAAGAIDAAAIAANAIGASEFAQDAAQEIADEVLNRDLAGGGSGNTRNVRNALRSLRNKAAIAGGTLTVYAENDTDAAWTAVVTTAAGNPIDSIDPA